MKCVNCPKTKPIPTCVLELTIGTIAMLNEPIAVFINDATNNRLEAVMTTSGPDGLVKIDTSESIFMDNHSYEIWIEKAGEQNQLPITIDGNQHDCLLARFQMQFDGDGDLKTTVAHVISMES